MIRESGESREKTGTGSTTIRNKANRPTMRFALCNGGGGGGGGGSSGGGDSSGGVADGRVISWEDPLLGESLIFSFFVKA